MGILNNIRLKTKLFAVVAFLILVSVGISGIVYVSVREISGETEQMQATNERIRLLGRMNSTFLSYVRGVEFLPLEMDESQRQQFERHAEDDLKQLRAYAAQFKPAVEAGRQELDSFLSLVRAYESNIHKPVQGLSRENKLDDATRLAFEGDKRVSGMRRFLVSLEERNTSIYTNASRLLSRHQKDLLENILIVAAAGIILGLLAAFTTIVIGITRPLMLLIGAMQRLANGKTDEAAEGTERRDEIGLMAKAVEVFRENALERRRLEGEMRRERDIEKARQARIDELITQFRGNIGDIRTSLDGQLSVLQSSSTTLGRIAEEASLGANVAGAATSEASENVAHVASAASELTAASREISIQVHKASEYVTQAMDVAGQADEDVSSLANLADRIGAIIDIINSIAEQTNMLALNATIEAARAGEAGRSFAVVASEVKTLAGQTAKATEEISAQVQAIQQATQQAVASIRSITHQVSEIQGRTTAIAAAVEEQEASTHEISRAIALASSGSEQVAGSVSTMVQSVEQTSAEAGQLRTISGLISDVSGNLTHTVDHFLRSVTEDVAERRRVARKAIRQVGIVTTQGRRHQTAVLDISLQGLRIEATPDMRLGDRIEIEWQSGERFRGNTVWIANGQAGISLEVEISARLMNEAA